MSRVLIVFLVLVLMPFSVYAEIDLTQGGTDLGWGVATRNYIRNYNVRERVLPDFLYVERVSPIGTRGITSPFGMRWMGSPEHRVLEFHRGVDIPAPLDYEIVMPAHGDIIDIRFRTPRLAFMFEHECFWVPGVLIQTFATFTGEFDVFGNAIYDVTIVESLCCENPGPNCPYDLCTHVHVHTTQDFAIAGGVYLFWGYTENPVMWQGVLYQGLPHYWNIHPDGPRGHGNYIVKEHWCPETGERVFNYRIVRTLSSHLNSLSPWVLQQEQYPISLPSFGISGNTMYQRVQMFDAFFRWYEYGRGEGDGFCLFCVECEYCSAEDPGPFPYMDMVLTPFMPILNIEIEQHIAGVGDTGRSYGPHLHFELTAHNNLPDRPSWQYPNKNVNPPLYFPFYNAHMAVYWSIDYSRIGRPGFPRLIEVTDVSIVANYYNPVFRVFLSNSGNEYINRAILYGTEYRFSLYQRFGNSILFVPYFGEKNIELNMLDFFYEQVSADSLNFQFRIRDVFAIRRPQLWTNIYPRRPNIVSEASGARDPRREQFGAIHTGGMANLGNMYLIIGNNIFRLVMFFKSMELVDFLFYLAGDIIDVVWEWVVESVWLAIFALFVYLAIWVFIQSVKILKGDSTLKILFGRLGNLFVSLVLILVFLSNPLGFRPTALMNEIQSMFNELIEFLEYDCDVVVSTYCSSLATEAVIWRHAILDNWSLGMFGRRYNEMYMIHGPPERIRETLYQTDAIVDGVGRSSVYHTNRIDSYGRGTSVPLGGGWYSYNWAAFAWSTQSIYHIQTPMTMYDWRTGQQYSYWQQTSMFPSAITTPRNEQIFIDKFIWKDATLNIAPMHVNGIWIPGYNDARQYEPMFVRYGARAFFMSLLLLPLMYPIIKRFISIILIIGIGVRIIYKSLGNFISPTYNPLSNILAVIKPIYEFFWWTLIMHIMIVMYLYLTDTFFMSLFYLAMCFAIIKLAHPPTSRRQLVNAYRTVMNKLVEYYRIFNKKVV